MKLRNAPIKWKLFFYLSLFCVVLLTMLWLFQIVFLEDFYKSIKIREIKSTSSLIAKNIDHEEISSLITRISQGNEMCVSVIDVGGNTIYQADILPDCVIHKMGIAQLYTLYQQAKNGDGTYLERFNRSAFRNNQYQVDGFTGNVPKADHGLMESMIFTQVVTKSTGEELLIILNSTISPVNATVQTLRVQWMIITGTMLALALLLSFYLSRRIARPIIAINQQAKTLAKGNYDTQFPDPGGYREISQLAKTLDYAAGELSRVEALRRELIANVSHDLRTPLTMITGYAEVMRDIPGENNQENLQVIMDEAQRLTSLVNDTLDLSKLQAGMDQLNLESYDLTASIAEILKRYSALMQKDGYQITFTAENHVTVQADQLKMTQVIYNLVNNAIHYTGEDKRIQVHQQVTNGKVRISITDTGCGIPPDQLSAIWDRYYKVDKTHKRQIIGTGLGLSIVKQVLILHHAEYGVESTEGKGSTFWFILPIQP